MIEHPEKQESSFIQEGIEMVVSHDPNNFDPIPLHYNQSANQLIDIDRPHDLKPRLFEPLAVPYDEWQSWQQISDKTEINREQICIRPMEKSADEVDSPLKKKDQAQTEKTNVRYSCFEEKYKSNKYKCIYKKYNNLEFYSNIFSLQKTLDYNKNDYYCFQDVARKEAKQENVQFSSQFQSGNLSYAYQHLAKGHYDLLMQNDTNTRGYNQWFYFSVKSSKSQKIKINIVNFIKKKLMLKDGIRPVCKIVNEKGQILSNWQFTGLNLSYKKSYVTGIANSFRNYYTFSFQIQLQSGLTYYLALNHPYTYSQMVNSFESIVSTMPEQMLCQRKNLCHSISNNLIPIYTFKTKQVKSRKKVVVFGRQHPGETVGSYVLQGFVQEMLNFKVTEKIQFYENYELIVIPMVNPDGVIYGNFRTNLSGFDLNRQWAEPNRWNHPEIFFLKKYLTSLDAVEFILDCHGHSKQMNTFIYACTDPDGVEQAKHKYRVYPYIFSQQCNIFKLKNCTFNFTEDKLSTARISMFNHFNIPNIHTLQTSFYGYQQEKTGTNVRYRYQIEDLKEIGIRAAKSCLILFGEGKKLESILKEVKEKSSMFDAWNLQSRNDYESESDPDGDLLPLPIRRKILEEKKKNSPLKKRKSTMKKIQKQKLQKSPSKKSLQVVGKKSINRDRTALTKNRFETQDSDKKPQSTKIKSAKMKLQNRYKQKQQLVREESKRAISNIVYNHDLFQQQDDKTNGSMIQTIGNHFGFNSGMTKGNLVGRKQRNLFSKGRPKQTSEALENLLKLEVLEDETQKPKLFPLEHFLQKIAFSQKKAHLRATEYKSLGRRPASKQKQVDQPQHIKIREQKANGKYSQTESKSIFSYNPIVFQMPYRSHRKLVSKGASPPDKSLRQRYCFMKPLSNRAQQYNKDLYL